MTVRLTQDYTSQRHTATTRLYHMVRALRPKQWAKNAFVLPALLFSGNLLDLGKDLAVAQVFALFSLLSSSVYLINDIADREKDREHPKKRNRPIAAGLITVPQAATLALLLAAFSLVWAFRINLFVGAIAAVYWVQTVLYSFYLKHVVLIDVFTLALGFVLRVLVGAAAIRVVISPWLLITTILLALFIALSKRRHEITSLKDPSQHRSILADYPLAFVDQLIAIVTSATLVVYALYSFLVSKDGRLIYTVPFVIYGIFRYLYLMYRKDGGGEPEAIVLRDMPLLIDMGLFGGVTVYLLYILP